MSKPVASAMDKQLTEADRSPSSISLAIETAFDFLNNEDCESDSESE